MEEVPASAADDVVAPVPRLTVTADGGAAAAAWAFRLLQPLLPVKTRENSEAGLWIHFQWEELLAGAVTFRPCLG